MGAVGEKHHSAKLIEDDVRTIRKLYDSGVSVQVIAKDYPVHFGVISRAANRITWRCVR